MTISLLYSFVWESISIKFFQTLYSKFKLDTQLYVLFNPTTNFLQSKQHKLIVMFTNYSRLHLLLMDDKEPNMKESFYALVELMMQTSEKKLHSLLLEQPTIRSILEKKHEDFLDYFSEVERCIQ